MTSAAKAFLAFSALVIAVMVLSVITFINSLRLTSLATVNRNNGELLVDCVTPGPKATETNQSQTGHPCWDRLHDPRQTGAAILTILVESDCRSRRATAGLPAPDAMKPCPDQTPHSIYPGESTQ